MDGIQKHCNPWILRENGLYLMMTMMTLKMKTKVIVALMKLLFKTERKQMQKSKVEAGGFQTLSSGFYRDHYHYLHNHHHCH